MEKKSWTMPVAVVEKFEVTEYVAACQYSGMRCDAPVYSDLLACNKCGSKHMGTLYDVGQQTVIASGFQNSVNPCYFTKFTVDADQLKDGYLDVFSVGDGKLCASYDVVYWTEEDETHVMLATSFDDLTPVNNS